MAETEFSDADVAYFTKDYVTRNLNYRDMFPLRLEEKDASWRQEANCQGIPVDAFFSTNQDDVINIRRHICGPCPVREQCAEFGKDEPYGIYGGETPQERKEGRPKKSTRTHSQIKHGTIGGWNTEVLRGWKPCQWCAAAARLHSHQENSSRSK